MIKIDAILSGFPKSGTTSVAELLARHPEVVFSDPKEPNLFLGKEPGEREVLSVLPEDRTGKIVMEGSQRYSIRDRFPYLAERMHKHNPRMKLLFIARHPLERAQSHFKMLDRDMETQFRIESIMSEESLRQNVFKTSLYFYQLKPYLDVFSREQIKICFFENYVRKPEAFMSEICDFLKIEYHAPEKTVHLNKANLSSRSTGLYDWLNASPIYNRLKLCVPVLLRDRYRHWLKKDPSIIARAKMSASFRQHFMDAIRDDLDAFLSFAQAPQEICEYYRDPDFASGVHRLDQVEP